MPSLSSGSSYYSFYSTTPLALDNANHSTAVSYPSTGPTSQGHISATAPINERGLSFPGNTTLSVSPPQDTVTSLAPPSEYNWTFGGEYTVLPLSTDYGTQVARTAFSPPGVHDLSNDGNFATFPMSSTGFTIQDTRPDFETHGDQNTAFGNNLAVSLRPPTGSTSPSVGKGWQSSAAVNDLTRHSYSSTGPTAHSPWLAPGPASQHGMGFGDGPSNAVETGLTLATAFEPQPPTPPNGNNLTDFTKRKKWASKILQELVDILQVVDADGKILFVSPSIRAITGHSPEEVLNRHLEDFVHPDDIGILTADMNEAIASGNQFRVYYRLKKKDGAWATLEAIGHAHIAEPKFAPNPQNQSAFCQAVIMALRPYPSKTDRLFDSFLEQKIEHERLTRGLDDVHEEDADEPEDADGGQEPAKRRRNSASSKAVPINLMPPPERPRVSDQTRATGALGILLPLERDARAKERRKKISADGQHVCSDCGKPPII